MSLENKKRVVFFLNPWASGEIRGRQVGEKLREKGYEVGFDCPTKEEDIKIFIKTRPENSVKNAWVDVVDCIGVVPIMMVRPDLGVIAISRIGEKTLRANLPASKIVFIPEHHCNWVGEWRGREKKVETVGYCGYTEGLALPVEKLAGELSKVGLKFLYQTNFKTRQDIVEFYKKIDIQVAFRPDSITYPEFRNPLKLENAGSFGIPTVCFPELTSWDEWGGCFVSVASGDEMVWQCKLLKENPEYYKFFGDKAFERSKLYSIDRIVDRYVELIENGNINQTFFE